MIAAKLTSNFDIAALPKVALRRVRVGDISTWPKMVDDPVALCLELWKTWMQGDPDRNMGAGTMRGLMGDGDGHGMDAGEAQQLRDNRIAAATDAEIGGLSRIHRWAINTSCSITTMKGLDRVWRFPNADLFDAAEEARSELEKKLRKNVCTSVLF